VVEGVGVGEWFCLWQWKKLKNEWNPSLLPKVPGWDEDPAGRWWWWW